MNRRINRSPKLMLAVVAAILGMLILVSGEAAKPQDSIIDHNQQIAVAMMLCDGS